MLSRYLLRESGGRNRGSTEIKKDSHLFTCNQQRYQIHVGVCLSTLNRLLQHAPADVACILLRARANDAA